MNLREPEDYSPILDKVTSKIWKEAEYFPFVPTTRHLGHLFWELIMAISVARKTGRSLVLLRPSTSTYKIVNEDAFDCDFLCKVERSAFQKKLMKALVIYERGRTSIKRRLLNFLSWFWPITTARPQVRYHRCGIETSRFVMPKVKGTRHYFDLDLLQEDAPSLRLTDAQRAKARSVLASYGFDETNWFAVAHVREAGFRGFEDDHDARNFSQQSLLPMISRIHRDGGLVVRIGTRGQPYVPKTTGLFDYSRSGLQSGLLDMYLMEKSRYYLGSSSGTLSVAYAFAKPAFVINYVDFLTAGLRVRDMFIPKRPYDPAEHRFLSISEYCRRATSTWDAKSYWFVENQMEDIESAFEDFLRYEEDGFTLRGEDNDIYREWLEVRAQALNRIIADPASDQVGESFKDVAVSTLDAPAVLAPSFLRRYLFQDECVSQNRQTDGDTG